MSLEVEGVPVELVLEFVARRLDAELVVESGVYYLGQLREEDNGVLVRRVGRLSAEDIKRCLDVVVTQGGRAEVLEDGLVVVSEKARVIRRAVQVLEGLSSPGSGWVVQFLLLEGTSSVDSSYGVDTKLDLDVSAAFASASTVTEYSGAARAALKADLERQRVHVWAQPLFLVRDGQESTIKRVSVVPVPEYTTLETGAVVTSGYTDVEIGLEAVVRCREWAAGVAGVGYELKLGEIQGFVDDRVPIRTEESLSGMAAMCSGGTYLLGSLERGRARSAVSGPAQLLHGRTLESSRLEVWCLVDQVGFSSAVARVDSRDGVE